MLNKFLIVILFLLSRDTFSQILIPTENYFKEEVSFSPKKIKEANIKSISLTYSEKYDNKTIQRENKKKIYYFDENGLIIREVYKESRGIFKDSIRIEKKYNSDTLLAEKVQNYNGDIVKSVYQYNKNKRLKKIYTIKYDDFLNADTIATEVFMERYADEQFVKRVQLNSENRPYLEERLYFDEKHRLIKQEKDLIITAKTSKKEWKYNTNNQIAEIKYQDNINSNHKGRYFFEYRLEDQQLEYIYHSEEEETIEKTVLVYSATEKKRVDAVVIRNNRTAKISIIELDYSYY